MLTELSVEWNICAGLSTSAKASGNAKVPGRISKVRGSRILVASPPAQAQQGRGVSVMAVFVLAEVVVKSQSGQGWGQGKSQEKIYRKHPREPAKGQQQPIPAMETWALRKCLRSFKTPPLRGQESG